MTDDLSANEALAARIKNYWYERGHAVQAVVLPVTFEGLPPRAEHTTFYSVRSDMLGGLPRDHK